MASLHNKKNFETGCFIAQAWRSWSGSCSNSWSFILLLGYEDGNDSVWRIMAKK